VLSRTPPNPTGYGGEDINMQDICRRAGKRETTRESIDVGGWTILRWISERWNGVDWNALN
jgi:hypothetical protein